MELFNGNSWRSSSSYDGGDITNLIITEISASTWIQLFSLAIVNSYLVWIQYVNCDGFYNRLQAARSRDSPAFELRQSAKRLPRKEPFRLFPERASYTLLDMAGSHERSNVNQGGAQSPDCCCNDTSPKKRRRTHANNPFSSRQRLDWALSDNEVRMDKGKWCPVYSIWVNRNRNG